MEEQEDSLLTGTCHSWLISIYKNGGKLSFRNYHEHCCWAYIVHIEHSCFKQLKSIHLPTLPRRLMLWRSSAKVHMRKRKECNSRWTPPHSPTIAISWRTYYSLLVLSMEELTLRSVGTKVHCTMKVHASGISVAPSLRTHSRILLRMMRLAALVLAIIDSDHQYWKRPRKATWW